MIASRKLTEASAPRIRIEPLNIIRSPVAITTVVIVGGCGHNKEVRYIGDRDGDSLRGS